MIRLKSLKGQYMVSTNSVVSSVASKGKVTEKVRYFVGGDYKLTNDLCRGQYEFINELLGVTAYNEHNKITHIPYLLEFETLEDMLRVYRRARELNLVVDLWQKSSSHAAIRQIPRETIKKKLNEDKSKTKTKKPGSKAETKRELVDSGVGITTAASMLASSSAHPKPK